MDVVRGSLEAIWQHATYREKSVGGFWRRMRLRDYEVGENDAPKGPCGYLFLQGKPVDAQEYCNGIEDHETQEAD